MLCGSGLWFDASFCAPPLRCIPIYFAVADLGGGNFVVDWPPVSGAAASNGTRSASCLRTLSDEFSVAPPNHGPGAFCHGLVLGGEADSAGKPRRRARREIAF